MKTYVSRRDNSIEENQAVDASALRQFKQKHPNICNDERKSDGPETPPADVVGEREGDHKKGSSKGNRQIQDNLSFAICI
jgi:hypothetical protein